MNDNKDSYLYRAYSMPGIMLCKTALWDRVWYQSHWTEEETDDIPPDVQEWLINFLKVT